MFLVPCYEFFLSLLCDSCSQIFALFSDIFFSSQPLYCVPAIFCLFFKFTFCLLSSDLYCQLFWLSDLWSLLHHPRSFLSTLCSLYSTLCSLLFAFLSLDSTLCILSPQNKYFLPSSIKNLLTRIMEAIELLNNFAQNAIFKSGQDPEISLRQK